MTLIRNGQPVSPGEREAEFAQDIHIYGSPEAVAVYDAAYAYGLKLGIGSTFAARRARKCVRFLGDDARVIGETR